MEVTKKKNHIKYNRGFMIASFVILLIYSFLLLYLLFWVAMTSFKSSFEFSNNKMGFIEKWNFKNYTNAIDLYVLIGTRKIYMEEMLGNTVLYCALYTIVPLFANTCIAYACAKYKCLYSSIVYNAVVFFMVFPIVGGLSGALELSMKIGSYDNIWVAVLFQFKFGGTTFLVLYATFKGIPRDYMEAAQMDGAGHYRIMFTIMWPMASATILVYAINMLIGLWNDWNTALIWFLSSPTIAYGLYRFSSNGTGNTAAGVPVQCATCVMSAVPAIIFFACFKNKIVGKIAVGGLKG